ncbi:hypothetical protein E2C01_089374 [Portunus trituberculatus]|uniref:Uncharacterized protein n=1 Tax=Portunus trituberculatus TaxID=210409 RepID=A0A5B7JM80_PORTR|nr:hypothetical protein [Portunus trituberculatus]
MQERSVGGEGSAVKSNSSSATQTRARLMQLTTRATCFSWVSLSHARVQAVAVAMVVVLLITASTTMAATTTTTSTTTTSTTTTASNHHHYPPPSRSLALLLPSKCTTLSHRHRPGLRRCPTQRVIDTLARG